MKTLLAINPFYHCASGLPWIIIVVLVCCFQVNSIAQCDSVAASVFGDPFIEEKGRCLTKSVFSDAIYVAGNRNDSTLLIKFDFNGRILWAKTIDVVPGVFEVPAGIVEDDEGMVAIYGTAGPYIMGGKVYGIRIDPTTQIPLWAKLYSQSLNDFCFGMAQKGPGGNYLVNTQPTYIAANYEEAHLMEIDRATGNLVPSFSKNYFLNGTETLNEVLYHENFIYGVGRYKDAAAALQMRNTLVKLDPDDGSQHWVKMGHISVNAHARLYGTDLVIADNTIYSICLGDPTGHSITNTKLYVQRTDLDGNLIWINQYELPGNTDFGADLIASGNGFVVYAFDNTTYDSYLFKIDADGNVIWAKDFEFNNISFVTQSERSNSLLIEAGNQLVIAGFGTNTTGNADLVLIRTDLNGELQSPCMSSKSMTIQAQLLSNPIFYNTTPEEKLAIVDVTNQTPQHKDVILSRMPECGQTDVISHIEFSICEGEQYQSYTESGNYTDTFSLSSGCDSIRILHLEVENCGCGIQSATVYGQPGITEKGLSIAPTLENDGYYIAGIRSDSVLIMKFNINDKLEWSYIIDAVNGKKEYPIALITDSEGMLALTGMATDNPGLGGNPFLLRFNPLTQTLLWSREITSTYEVDRVHGLMQNGSGGNYLLSTNPADFMASVNDFQIMEFDPLTGASVSGIAKNFHLGNSNYIVDLIRHNEFLYGAGRYSLGVGNHLLRNTITKLDAMTMDEIWTRVGHKTQNEIARVYGFDALIDEGFIYTGIYGDPDGTSVTETKVFVQKTSLDGALIWLKQYDLPLNTDFGYEIVKSDNGYVIYANHRSTAGELYMFKINSDGTVLWANWYNVSGNVNTVTFNIGGNQMIAINDDLILTASVDDAMGGEDILIIHTDAEGLTDAPCVTVVPITLQVTDLINPDFYEVQVVESDFPFVQTEQATEANPVEVPSLASCTQNDFILTQIEITICEGEEYDSYSTSGMYQDTFLTTEGCDSIRTLNLTVEYIQKNEIVQICSGVSYKGYDQTGNYVDTIQGPIGTCDTIRFLNLEVLAPLTTFINSEICEGQQFLGYEISGMYSDTLQTSDGCDSIRLLQLSVLSAIEQTVITEICSGEQYEGYLESGTYMDMFQTNDGCDSVRLLQLTVVNAIEETIIVEICSGEQFEGYLQSGVYKDTFQTNAACDSIRILELMVLDEIISTPLVAICLGDTYEGKSVSGIYIDTMQSISGCDSIVHLQLEVVAVAQDLFIELCPGQSFEQYNLSGTYIDTLQGIMSPCDTIRNLTLSFSIPIDTSIVENICEGESYYGYTASGTYTDTLVSMAGCDSIRTVSLFLTESVESHMVADVCEGIFFGHSKPGTYIDTLISNAGCDSIRTVVLEGTTIYVPNIFSPNDDGINDLFEIVSFPDNGLDVHYFGIFDRFGNMAYQTDTWPIKWTGKDAKGRSFQPGVFAYSMIYHCGQNEIIKHGSITLIK